MEWNSKGLFATPLIRISINDIEWVKDFFYQNIHSNEETATKNSNNATVAKLKHYHSFENVFTLYDGLEPLRKKIEEAGTFAYQSLLNYTHSGPMKITNAWFNLCNVGGSQIKHSHANNLLSGTLYLHTDQHSNIEFYHPLTTDSLHAELYDEPDYSPNDYGLKYHLREIKIPVNTGDCLFWPSQLRHGYKNNLTPQRLSLSFNMMPSQLNTTYQTI